MKVILNLFILIFFASCSSVSKRVPTSSNILDYQKDGTIFVEINIELSNKNPRVKIPRFSISSIDYDQEDTKVNLEHADTVSCILSDGDDVAARCALIRGNKGLVKVIYSFDELKVFPVYEVDWATNTIKKQFSKQDVFLSKINRKVKRIKNLNSLFFNEKISLLKSIGSIEKVELNFPKRKIFKFNVQNLDLVLLDNISSSIKHKTLGTIPVKGLDRNQFVDDEFEESDLKAFEFYCKDKRETYLIEEGLVLIDRPADKVKCKFNDRVRGMFGRFYTRGSIHFNVVSLNLSDALTKIENIENKNEIKLKAIIDNLNNSNINRIYNGLSKIHSIYGL